LKILKHDKTIYCPWCKAGARMTWQDGDKEYCMACMRDLKTGETVKDKEKGH